MRGPFEALGRTALFALEPETAHGVSIAALKSGLVPTCRMARDARLETKVAGLSFPNPLGIAAGYDKNAEVPDALSRLGFGFVEIGTVTPKPQAGNPRPRIFRLPAERAVINRLGFNNEGHDAVRARLERRSRGMVLGVNIGANKDSEDRIGDYVAGIEAFARIADYFTVNVSSPNTPGLRNLQTRASLGELLARILVERDLKAAGVPVFLKIAPDLAEDDLDDVAAECLEKQVDGVIVSNTTLSRTDVANARHADEAGGLSGRPLFERSTIVLAKMRARLGRDMPIIGVGGVDSAETALEKIYAGADLVQLYTGFIYGGPALPGRIVAGLSDHCRRDNLPSLSVLRDRKTDLYAARPIPA
jgi:dihydroorotate dehydrogenase, subfamily 2